MGEIFVILKGILLRDVGYQGFTWHDERTEMAPN